MPVKEESELAPQHVEPLREVAPPAQPEPFYAHYAENVPIALDIGASSFKIGLASLDDPHNVFPTLVARYRDRRAAKTVTLVGNDVYRDPGARTSIKLPFDGALVTNWDYVEYMLDYLFEHLGVSSSGGVNNPVVMTELLAVPQSQRKGFYELLFEVYNAPKVAFGIDLMFLFYQNNDGKDATGVVISGSHEHSHVMPVVEGKGLLLQTKRIDWGGSQLLQYLQRLLLMKYPYFPARLTPAHTTHLFQDHCYVSELYQEDLALFLAMDRMETNDVVVQAPVDVTAGIEKKKTDEEVARLTERRREQGRRLQAQAAQKRLEKLVQKEKELAYYTELAQQLEGLLATAVQRRMETEEFDNLADFKKYVAALEKTLRKARVDASDDDTSDSVDPATAWPLAEVPDDQLSEQDLREKRKQRLMKANFEARQRAREAKAEEEALKAQEEAAAAEWRLKDLAGWCSVQREELAKLVDELSERAKLMALYKDRKSAAAQQRMKNIADLAGDEAQNARKRRRGNATIDNDPTDSFGANDDDWSVYRDISNAGLEEAQAATTSQIESLEADLLRYDPNFHHEDTLAAAQTFDWKSLVLHKFLHGPRKNLLVALQQDGHDPDDVDRHPEIIRRLHQLHLNVERIRVPEVLFQPNIAGLDQAGIGELALDALLRRLDGNFTSGTSLAAAQNVFVTGGLAKLRNLVTRINTELTSVLPVGVPLRVRCAQDPLLDAWRGMRLWANSAESQASYVSRQEYVEMGAEYIKEHGLGNACLR